MTDRRDQTADAELDTRIIKQFLDQARADGSLVEGDGPLRFVGMSADQTRLVIEDIIAKTRAAKAGKRAPIIPDGEHALALKEAWFAHWRAMDAVKSDPRK